MKIKQWDYVGKFREGKSKIMMNNPLYAKYVCPHTEEIKIIKLDNGNLLNGNIFKRSK